MLLAVCLVMSVLICMTEANWYGKRCKYILFSHIFSKKKDVIILIQVNKTLKPPTVQTLSGYLLFFKIKFKESRTFFVISIFILQKVIENTAQVIASLH